MPHKGDHVVPSEWVQVTQAMFGLNRVNLKVRSYSIALTKSSVWASMSTDQYLEPS